MNINNMLSVGYINFPVLLKDKSIKIAYVL